MKDPLADLDRQTEAFEAAERSGMVHWCADALDWAIELEPFLIPEKIAALPRDGFTRYGIALVRAKAHRLREEWTYTFTSGEAALAVCTLTPAEYARYRAGYEQGRDYIRRQCRKAGIAA